MADTWVKELEFCEANHDHLIRYLAKRWNMTAQHVVESIADASHNYSWHYLEVLYYNYFNRKYFHSNAEYFQRLFNKTTSMESNL